MLTKCSECGGVISDKAITCPHCGAPFMNAETELENHASPEVSSSRSSEPPSKTQCTQDPFADSSVTYEQKNGIDRKSLVWKYVREFFVIFFTLIGSCFCAGIANCAASELMGRSIGQGGSTAWALSVFYFAWPIEMIVSKYNSFRAGRIVGNVLFVLIGLLVLASTFHATCMRWYLDGGSGFVLFDAVPIVLFVAAVKYIVNRRVI